MRQGFGLYGAVAQSIPAEQVSRWSSDHFVIFGIVLILVLAVVAVIIIIVEHILK